MNHRKILGIILLLVLFILGVGLAFLYPVEIGLCSVGDQDCIYPRAFNLGELMMARAIHAYVITTATINEQRADVEKRFASTKEVATAYYAGFYKLNYASFLEDNPAAEAARDSLTRDLKVHGEKFDDVHKHYVSKVLAGDYIMRKANSPRMY